MFGSWITAHDPRRAFLFSDRDVITFGDLVAARADGPDQVVVEPGDGVQSVLELAAVVGTGRQVVVVDPLQPSSEMRRRVGVAREARGRDAATILFTSGTTGPAKAVRLTESNWEAAAQASRDHLDHRPDDVWLAAMPIHHVGGLSILFRCAFVGGAVRWIPRFDVPRVAAALRADVTMASLVPTMLRRLLDHDDGEYGGLRSVLIGGGPIPSGLLEEARERGLPVLPTYGMTETCAQVATLRPGSPPRRAAHPLPGVEVEIGDGGRIRVRGRQVSPGYADEDDRPPTAWFTTPDRGELTDDGALRVLGRVDDVIVTGGENVDPGRVEAELSAHDQVEDVVVVGLADEEWGEVVAAGYTGAVPPDELGEWARTRLAPHEVPRRFRRVGRIPLTEVGKPDRAALKRLVSGRG